MYPQTFSEFMEERIYAIFTRINPGILPDMFQRKDFTLVEKRDLIIAFFLFLSFILVFLAAITVLLLIITALHIVSLLSIRYEGIIDTLLVFMGIVFITIVGLYVFYQQRWFR